MPYSLSKPFAIPPTTPLSSILDVHHGVLATDAAKTLEILGFKAAPLDTVKSDPSWLDEKSTLKFWHHPQGLALAGWAGKEGELFSIRMSAAIDAGWGELPELDKLRTTTSYCDDGTRVLNLNASLDREGSGTLFEVLEEMNKKGVLIAGFGRWAELARSGRTGGWLFCVGDQTLKGILSQDGLENWFGSAPAGFLEFLGHREAHVSGRVLTRPPEPSWKVRLADAYRQLGVSMGQDRPTESQKKQFREWVQIGTGERPWRRDWSTQEGTGLMLPHVLALMLTERRAQDRLLKWCRQAPESALRKAFVGPHQSSQDTAINFLVRGHIQCSLPPSGQAPQNASAVSGSRAVAQALEIIAERTGGASPIGVEHALRELASPHLLSGEKITEEFIQDFIGLLEIIRHLSPGRPNPDNTKEPRSGEHPHGAGHWESQLASLVPIAPWEPLVSRLREWEMEDALPQVALDGGSLSVRKARL